jgi:ABC-2 type transport system permease protein
MSRKLGRIIRMEFRLTTANKVFIVLTILGPFLIVAVTVLPTLLAAGQAAPEVKEPRIAVVNADPEFLQELEEDLFRFGIIASAYGRDTARLDDLVSAGEYTGYIKLPDDLADATQLVYVTTNKGDSRVKSVLESVIGLSVIKLRLNRTSLDPEQVASIGQPPAVVQSLLPRPGEEESQDRMKILFTGLTLVMLLYMTVLLYGQTIGRSVLNEKTLKTVEIMLSSVSPMDLLFGKVLGKGLASLLQYGIWVSASLAFMKLVGPRIGVTLQLAITPATLGWLVVFFLLAFFIYSAIYAGLGAASEDEQHLGQLAWPAIVFLVIPMVMIWPILNSPDSAIVVGMSFFPLTGSVVMFMRILAGAVGIAQGNMWQVWLAIGLQLATIVLLIALSAKIFRVGILMTGRRFKLGEILSWIRA